MTTKEKILKQLNSPVLPRSVNERIREGFIRGLAVARVIIERDGEDYTAEEIENIRKSIGSEGTRI